MRSLLLIVSGSIAAYKSLELIRRGQARGYHFTPILTAGGSQFITPLSLSALAKRPCYTDLFSLKDEQEMGHIRLAREHDAVLVMPASADMIAKMASGRTDDLASAALLATTAPVLIAPAMNPAMWQHPAVQANLSLLKDRGVQLVEPSEGMMACGEEGMGRLADPDTVLDALDTLFLSHAPLAGLKAIVTAGATREPIDPVRYLSNHSSGKQGYAIAEALAKAGAQVTLISGITALPCPLHVRRIEIETAEQMAQATLNALPAEIAVCTAAVADWRPIAAADQKIKKTGETPTAIALTENTDILKALAVHPLRPALLIGFAAETEAIEAHAKAKLLAKGCDWLVANDVSANVFGTDENQITLFTRHEATALPRMSKYAIARWLVERITDHFTKENFHAQPSRSHS